MPDQLAPSEFGGKVGPDGVQPPPHVPTAAEELSLGYRTRTLDNGTRVLDHDTFDGLLPEDEQIKLLREAGDLDKGQIWEQMNG